MQFCQPHWDAMRKGVDDRGMMHLVTKSGQDALAAEVRALEGQPPEAGDWCPLMAAHWAIANKALERIGASDPRAALAAFGDPAWCPLCELQRSYDWWSEPGRPSRPSNALEAQGWLDSCLDAMLKHAREQRLMPATQ